MMEYGVGALLARVVRKVGPADLGVMVPISKGCS